MYHIRHGIDHDCIHRKLSYLLTEFFSSASALSSIVSSMDGKVEAEPKIAVNKYGKSLRMTYQMHHSEFPSLLLITHKNLQSSYSKIIDDGNIYFKAEVIIEHFLQTRQYSGVF